MQPPIPYDKHNEVTEHVESGFKPIRGNPTEGRYLTFEAWDYALRHHDGKLTASSKSDKHDGKDQRFILHAVDHVPTNTRFKIATAGKHAKYVTKDFELGESKHAAVFTITDRGNGQGYNIASSSKHLSLDRDGNVSFVEEDPSTFTLYSVTY